MKQAAMISTMGAATTATMSLSASLESRQPSSTGASHRSRTLTLFAAPASPPEGKKQIQSKTCGFAAGLPSHNPPYKKRNSRVASAAGVPEHLSNSNYNCFHTINCQIRGSSYSKTPSFGKNTTAKKWQSIFTNCLVSGNPCAQRGWFPFFVLKRNIPTHTTAPRRKRNENRDTFNYYS